MLQDLILSKQWVVTQFEKQILHFVQDDDSKQGPSEQSEESLSATLCKNLYWRIKMSHYQTMT
jgi:hypothetical protein